MYPSICLYSFVGGDSNRGIDGPRLYGVFSSFYSLFTCGMGREGTDYECGMNAVGVWRRSCVE